MKIISFFNPIKNSRKTISSILFSKLFSKNNKVILIDLDPFSYYPSLFSLESSLNVFDLKIQKKHIKNIFFNVDLLRINTFVEKENNDINLYFNSLINLLKEKEYEIVIFDCSSSYGIINQSILKISNNTIIPFLINDEEIENVCNFFYSLQLKENTPIFIPFSNTQDKEINSLNFINIQKKLGFVSLSNVINLYLKNEPKYLIKNDKLFYEYKFIFKKIFKNK